MHSDNSKKTSFYQLLGRVFYAAAQADNVVHEEEVETLKKMVREKWQKLEGGGDEPSSELVQEIEHEFDQLLEKDAKADSVIKDLEEFQKENPDFFTSEVVELIMDTTNQIISSFAQSNKSEVLFLSELHFLLRK
ncbi:MAG: hypothetical protein ACFHU9_01750 [Fluviicola sp.]